MRTPNRSSRLRWKLASGVPFANFTLATAGDAAVRAANDENRQVFRNVAITLAHAERRK
jgi:hypothetical protein